MKAIQQKNRRRLVVADVVFFEIFILILPRSIFQVARLMAGLNSNCNTFASPMQIHKLGRLVHIYSGNIQGIFCMFCLFISYMYNCISMFIYLISSYFDRSLYYRCTNIFSVIHLKSRINAHYEVTAKVSKIFSRIWLFRSLFPQGTKFKIYVTFMFHSTRLKLRTTKTFPVVIANSPN